MAKVSLTIFLCLLACALADFYLHNPRGSNDRLDEANTNRNNANRLFDSQNNAKGGYCIGPQMTYYEGSMLSIEWTNQHGCGSNPKLVCQIVIQYMCGTTDDDPLKLIRDGTTTNTIPTDQADDLQFGMHESLQNYLNCNTRERNMGLYIADRKTEGGLNTNRRTAIYTRQNNNGNRHGLECAEERDYYPYWHPSEWKDVAILTSKKKFCDFYQSNSQNVKSKSYCGDKENLGVHQQPNNAKDCDDAGLDWIEQDSWGLEAPECLEVPWSRENQLGNGANGYANMYNWTLPRGEPCVKTGNCICVLRARYNISSEEPDHPDMNRPDTGFIDYTNNDKGSVQFQDPTVEVGGDNDTEGADGAPNQLEIASDTTQFGRTFQDRSHTWVLKKRPKGINKNARIYNLNVKGKRGNIVQTYPSTEYDFIPQYLYIRVGDYIHFQWTGCDNNPAGNAGEGTAGTDRSNMVQMINAHASLPATDAWLRANKKKVLFQDPKLRLRFAMLDQPNCKPYAQVLAANGGNADAATDNCAKLNAADRYFDGGAIQMNLTGTFYYMSTRNHNFSNRDQKGVIYVKPLLPPWAIGLVVTGAIICFAAGIIAVAMLYARQYPHSNIANIFSKM